MGAIARVMMEGNALPLLAEDLILASMSLLLGSLLDLVRVLQVAEAKHEGQTVLEEAPEADLVGVAVLKRPLVLVGQLVEVGALQVDAHSPVEQEACDSDVEEGGQVGPAGLGTMQRLLVVVREHHAHAVDAQSERGEQRVDGVEHVLFVQILAAKFLSTGIVVPDLVGDSQRERRESKFLAHLFY